MMAPRSTKPATEGVHGPRWGRWTATVRNRKTGRPVSLGVYLSAEEAAAAIRAFNKARTRWRHAQGAWQALSPSFTPERDRTDLPADKPLKRRKT